MCWTEPVAGLYQNNELGPPGPPTFGFPMKLVAIRVQPGPEYPIGAAFGCVCRVPMAVRPAAPGRARPDEYPRVWRRMLRYGLSPAGSWRWRCAGKPVPW